MNPKVKRLRAEREKNCDKIAKLTARNEEIDREVMKLENTDIIGMVRALGVTPDQLYDMLQDTFTAASEAAQRSGHEDEPAYAEQQEYAEPKEYAGEPDEMEGQDNEDY